MINTANLSTMCQILERKNYLIKRKPGKGFYPGLEGLTSAFSIAYDYDYFDRKVRETHYDSLDNITNMEMFYYDDKGV